MLLAQRQQVEFGGLLLCSTGCQGPGRGKRSWLWEHNLRMGTRAASWPERLLFRQTSLLRLQRGLPMGAHGFWARAHVSAVFRGCGAPPAERGGHPPHTGSSDADTSQAVGIVLLPWGLVRLAGSDFWVDPKSGIPFRLSGWAWLLWETQTHAHTQRRQAQSDASRHTQTHVSTHTYSPSLSSPLPISFLGCFLFPSTLLPQKSPKHAVCRLV